MSDEEFSDLFDAEPTYNSKSAQANPKTVFTGFEKIQIAADINVSLPTDIWMSIFALLSIEPHQVWWRILSEVSKHVHHSLKLYFHRTNFTRYNSSATIAEYLAEEGYLTCLQYVHEHGARWDVNTCLDAAKNGHLTCLQYAHENSCAWNESTCYYSALNGQVECLKYAHEHGCDWSYTSIFAAAKTNRLACLKYAYENGCPRALGKTASYYDMTLMSAAAGNGSLECLKYLHEQGEPWTEDHLRLMAKYGHLDCVKYVLQEGCSFDEATICSYAADDLECLIYFREKGFPWSKASSEAARLGNIECLKYIHEKSGEWIGDEISVAYQSDSMACLKYAFENGCPVPPDLCAHRGYFTSPKIIEYAHSKVECTCNNYEI